MILANRKIITLNFIFPARKYLPSKNFDYKTPHLHITMYSLFSNGFCFNHYFLTAYSNNKRQEKHCYGLVAEPRT